MTKELRRRKKNSLAPIVDDNYCANHKFRSNINGDEANLDKVYFVRVQAMNGLIERS